VGEGAEEGGGGAAAFGEEEGIGGGFGAFGDAFEGGCGDLGCFGDADACAFVRHAPGVGEVGLDGGSREAIHELGERHVDERGCLDEAGV
jgi:hypothetical protein